MMDENNTYRIIDVFYSDKDLAGNRGNYLMLNIGNDKRKKNRTIFLKREEYHSKFGEILGQKIDDNPELSWDGNWESVEYALRKKLERISLSDGEFILLCGKPEKKVQKSKNYESFVE